MVKNSAIPPSPHLFHNNNGVIKSAILLKVILFLEIFFSHNLKSIKCSTFCRKCYITVLSLTFIVIIFLNASFLMLKFVFDCVS